MSNADKIKAALNRIKEGLATINTDEDWISFLRFQSLFYQYSFGNTIMIFLQNPEATYVMGYKAWNKLGRYVRKGSKGLAILAPCVKKIEVFKEPENKSEYHDQEGEKETKKVLSGFRIAYVYDIADTDGSDEMLPVLVKGLSGNSESEREIFIRLMKVISKEFIVQEITGTASKGSYNLETGIITVRSDLEYLQRIKTLLHETAHAYDFKMNPEEDIPRNRRELIAESVAMVVSMRLGLDTSSYSLSYIQSWLKNKEELKIIADTVQKVSYKIINMLAESEDSAFSNLKESED
ncbi:ArdC-like ssDNA-binding domain-containing protein [Butyrivibrio sp. AE2015]|uniref:ArdC-like ssDNA-binding domain-containing protein n=1 Tax=Butyrivibrio sp. AE2015 TaxID=1280663 RepID=UPI0003B41AE8|nr:ArdC-like ssDNA-binding domain-containing protein [Butyrivibrio sp. AE2015]